MITSTTSTLQGKTIDTYHGVVSGEAIMGANIVRDLFASVTDVIGGRSAAYEDKLVESREVAMKEMLERAQAMGANAVIGINLDFETIGQGMMMCIATGTAVTYRNA
ncbi:YbjQ family protein [Caryophanon tenue]|uniref:UPF0145 protein A6M13_04300 n=1 Tax=Caryophanon tenue TaxID=33978 RepID=A0A1C0Y8N3_9BACL|nr:YbjQ family protein [Caryophanon tenue]OCS83511.1 hypothetical protein A6M13_04300 [Caryophanon tenue]